MPQENVESIEKLATGIPGFDLVSEGGLPVGRTTLVVGSAGSGKTIFSCQFLVEGIKRGETGVFVSFEESPKNIRKNMCGFGWDISKWEEEGKWLFVDGSAEAGKNPYISGDYDFSPLLARIQYAINKIKATRVSMDSLGAIFSYLPNKAQVRDDLFIIASALRDINSTVILTSERNQEYGEISSHGVEEYVADNVIILRNVLVEEKRRRTLEILKYRGSSHQQGEFPFTILPEKGFVTIPLAPMNLEDKVSSTIRISSGNSELDKMCGSGFYRDSIILVSGATGTGKTLLATHFTAAGIKNGERSIYFSFEENRHQLIRNALGWGINLDEAHEQEKLKIIFRYPESTRLENHLIKIQEIIEEFQPQRVVIDSLTALEKVATLNGFREFIASLNATIRGKGITGLYTVTTPTLFNSTSATESYVSTSTDSIILLRYVEVCSEVRRGLAVIKMRGSTHDNRIREFRIDNQGIRIGRSFRNFTGILSGNPIYVEQDEVNHLFQDEAE
ncbi:circadian clock protein KaiC [Plectonema cf. radiosum LEGE 06105]|uniref:non-specific serine/threonine protein kinase n=1 Tax=Plectonema cf. radiosum LEGE 06105 TaxID=945769 RepID=A0A8J7F5D2_9CYAN|nr:circadian clock protein KaiC [Plectonema radiosum]MBE9216861.1 circadian clock protein KaiC [Plectonema cf. radiosum LEGE 06105]